MKNFKLLLLAAVLLCAAYSCEKAEAPMSSTEPEMVSLILSTGEPTKTHISDVVDADGFTEIHWDQGDQIKVFTDENYWNSNAFSFKMSESPNGKYAKFGGNVACKSTKFWAVYPERYAVSCSEGGNGSDLKVSIPSSQEAKSNNFANNLNISVAAGEIKEVNNGTLGMGDYELTEPIFVDFKNVCALLKFTAPSNASQISSVTISANEDIAGEMTIDYSNFADEKDNDPKIKGVSGSKSITMTGTFVAGQNYYFVVAPVAISGISMTIQTNSETRYLTKTTKSENSNTYQLQPGVVMSLGNVNLDKMKTVTATATHQTPSNVLSGTNVAFNLNDNSATSVSLTLKKSDNTATRTVNALTSAYTSDSNWPYLPSGAYTFSGSFTSNGVYVHVPTTSFSVPALTNSQLTVGEFTPFTSYSKKSTPAVANTLDGSTIYSDVTVNLSSAILGNSNYTSMIKVNGNAPVFATVDGNSCVGFGGNEWKSHTISSIAWTFDGVSASHTLETPQTVHVTGIPYDYSFTNKTLDAIKNDSWTANGEANILDIVVYKGLFLSSRKKEGGIFGLGGTEVKKNGYMVSRPFYIPATTNLQASVSTTGYVSVGRERQVTGYLGAVGSSNEKCGTSTSFKTTCSNVTSTGGSGVWYSVQFQTSKNRLCIASEQVTDNNGAIYHFLNEAHIRYAE